MPSADLIRRRPPWGLVRVAMHRVEPVPADQHPNREGEQPAEPGNVQAVGRAFGEVFSIAGDDPLVALERAIELVKRSVFGQLFTDQVVARPFDQLAHDRLVGPHTGDRSTCSEHSPILRVTNSEWCQGTQRSASHRPLARFGILGE